MIDVSDTDEAKRRRVIVTAIVLAVAALAFYVSAFIFLRSGG